jgi:hypothetical protein
VVLATCGCVLDYVTSVSVTVADTSAPPRAPRSCSQISARLPAVVEAFFFLSRSSDGQRARVRDVRREFIAAYSLQEATVRRPTLTRSVCQLCGFGRG